MYLVLVLDGQSTACYQATFEDDAAGAIPKDWKIAETAGQDKLAEWKVMEMEGAPNGKKVIALMKTLNQKRTFNLAISEKTSFKDVNIKLKLKAISGEED
ncbi:MAG: hypothetical protein AB1656_05355 [Candidatus Omnitrophota bacterium]